MVRRQWKTWSVGLMLLGALARSAAADDLPSTRIFLSLNEQVSVFSLLTLGSAPGATKPAGVDYALFLAELAAYVTKEVLPDAAEEYRESPLGSRWSREMPEHRNEFGSHCLTIVTQLGSALPSMPASFAGETSPTPLDYAVRTGTVFLAARQIWSAFRNNVENKRSGFSLDPKVSSRKVGFNLTFHW